MPRRLPPKSSSEKSSSRSRRAPRNERRNSKPLKALFFGGTIFIVCLISLNLFLHSSLFSLTEIEIRGLENVTPAELKEATRVREGMNLWKIKPHVFRKNALAIPRLKRVELERVLPSGLLIHVQERHTAALVSYHGYYLELSFDSVYIDIRNEASGGLPIIQGLLWGQMDVGTTIPDRARGEIIAVFLEALAEIPALPLAEINVENPQQITVYTPEGMEVWLGGREELCKKIEVLHSIYERLPHSLDEPYAGYLDLRVAETPVFRPLEK